MSHQTSSKANKKRRVEQSSSEVSDDSTENHEKLSVLKVGDIIFKITKSYVIAGIFEKREIDYTAFMRLTETDLTERMKIGAKPAKQIYDYIKKFQSR